MRVGAARVDITPPPGLPMQGFAARTGRAERMHDRLFARVIAFEGPTERAVLVVADLLQIDERLQNAIAREVQARIGLDREHLQLAATHTHSGPDFPELNSYELAIGTGIAAAVEEAWLARRDSVAAVGVAPVSGIGKNRRHQHEGPVDDDVTVLRLDDTAGEPIATLVNYSCHPTTLGPDNLLYSADFPGVVCRRLDGEIGGVSLFTTGAEGDVNPGGYSPEDSMIGIVVPWRTYASAERYGSAIASVALDLRGELEVSPSDRVWGRARVLELPRRRVPSVDDASRAVESASQLVATALSLRSQQVTHAALLAEAYARLELQHAASADNDSPVRVRVSALGLGPATHVGIQGELFTALGMDIKRELGIGRTFVAALCDGTIGYIPTSDAYPEGGYEPAVSPLAPGGGEAIVSAAVALAGGL